MAKVIKFPITPPEKFGPERVTKKRLTRPGMPGQLNLFTSGRVVRLHQLSPFEEALMIDEQGDLKRAKESYLKAIEQGDGIADAYCNLGILEWQEGHTAKAIDCFTKCLKEDPRHHEAHYNLANLYAEVENLALAQVHYQIAIEIEPTFTNSYFNLALTLAMARKFREAVQILERYRELSPRENHAQADDLIRKLNSF